MIQFPALMRTGDHGELQRDILGATRERMVREFCEALEIVTQEVALVLILEDLHWIDNPSLDVLSIIARRSETAKLLVIGTLRPVDLLVSESPLKRLRQDLLSHRLARELTLEGLLQADVHDYVAREYAGDAFPRAFAELIYRRSEGNPLFVTAMLDHLTQTGVLKEANGAWRLTVPVDRIDPDVPESLKQMLDLQMGNLSEDERLVLKCASVAGQQFTVCSVAIMLERPFSEIEQKCASLADRQFLQRGGMCELPSGVLTVEHEFKHSLYREALYRGLTITQRINLHRVLAEGMVAYDSPSTPVLAGKIAMHFEEGRQYEPAITHLIVAAQIASRRYAHREAMAVLEHARALLPKTTPQSRPKLEREILARIANVHYTLGEMQLSVEAYESLASRAAESGDRESEADALMALSHPASFVDPRRAISACQRSAQIAAEIRNSTLTAQAELLSACWRILLEGWAEEAGQTCDRAISALVQLGAEMPAYGRLLYARVLVYCSEYPRAIENAEQALQELTGGDRLWAAPAALYAKASALGHLGRLGESQKTLTRGFELARKDNNAEWIGALRYTSFWLKWHTFDVEGMRRIASDISDAGPSGLSQQMQIQLKIAQGFADLAAEQYEAARQYFEAVLDERTHAVLLWRSRMFARRGLSEAWLALGELAKARIEADRLTASVRNSRDLYMAAFAWEYSARLALASGAWGSAEQDILHALEILKKAEIPVAAWRVHATAWDVYQRMESSNAEIQRAKAQSVILQIAGSMREFESLRESFLSAKPVRRVFDAPHPVLRSQYGRA
jgi:tetratricopeptide (TPR) repeat protein